MKVVIIGGGTAGLATATKLRRLDENAEIVILEKSAEFAVSNCALPYYLSGQIARRRAEAGVTAHRVVDVAPQRHISCKFKDQNAHAPAPGSGTGKLAA